MSCRITCRLSWSSLLWWMKRRSSLDKSPYPARPRRSAGRAGQPLRTVFAALLPPAGKEASSKARVAPVRAAEDLLAAREDLDGPEVTFGGPQPVRLYRKR